MYKHPYEIPDFLFSLEYVKAIVIFLLSFSPPELHYFVLEESQYPAIQQVSIVDMDNCSVPIFLYFYGENIKGFVTMDFNT